MRTAVKLEQRIAALKRLQEQRIALTARRKAEMDAVVEVKQREIDNLEATLAHRSAELKVAT